MNEFLKLNWRIENPTQIDQQLCFLSEAVVSDSHVYKHFTKPLRRNLKRGIKLNCVKEKYVPGKKYYQQINRRSQLTKLEKSHCLKALKLIQSGKSSDQMTAGEKNSLKTYTTCQQKLVEENRNFLQFAQDMWEQSKTKPQKIMPGILKYSWAHWESKLQLYVQYAQFYKELSLVPLIYDESEASVHFQQVCNPLEVGTLARFSPPNLKEQCWLKNVTLPKPGQRLNSKLPVSQDLNIVNFLETNQFDCVISSSSLKQLTDYTNTKAKWTIPVVVKEVTVNNTNRKVVFIDKVLAKTTPNYYDLKYYSYKQLLKTNFCQHKAFSYPTEETHLDSNEEHENEEVDDSTLKKAKDRFTHHNVSYRVWNIKKIDTHPTLMKNKATNKEINLLVRCKLDACECTDQGVLFPVVLRPKIEQQLKYGSNVPSRSELAKDWTSLFFRIYSNLYRARMYSELSEVISVERCTIQKINSEALTHYNYKPMLGLGVLQRVLEELTDLKCGNYLLQHLPKHESFLAILKETPENESTYNLHSEVELSKIDTETRPGWLPIDVNYILPVHEEYDQPPATFRGFDHNPTQRKKKKKGARNKKKTKDRGEKDDLLV